MAQIVSSYKNSYQASALPSQDTQKSWNRNPNDASEQPYSQPEDLKADQ